MKYLIRIDGCDDSTEFEIELTDSELLVVEKISKLSKETSRYGCMPVINFEKAEVEHETVQR